MPPIPERRPILSGPPVLVKVGTTPPIKKRKRKRVQGLTPNQIKFLRVLYSARGPLSRRTLCDRTGCHPTNVTAQALGRVGKEEREVIDRKMGYPCLLTLGYVEIETIEVEGKNEEVYSLTPSGIKAYEEVLSQ